MVISAVVLLMFCSQDVTKADLFFVDGVVQQDVTTTHVGKDLLLECEAAGTPQPVIRWEFDRVMPKQVTIFAGIELTEVHNCGVIYTVNIAFVLFFFLLIY